MPSAAQLRQRMDAAGIGFAGIDGAWWLPACRPIALPDQLAQDLPVIGQAIFTLLDAVSGLVGVEQGVTALIERQVPAPLRGQTCPGPILSLRPDFQIHPTTDGLQLVATELESCPSAQGFAHALQVGYGLIPDLAAAFGRFLAGRTLLFVCSSQWSEFLFEQLAFCRALAEQGARAFVLYDEPIDEIAASVSRGERWQPPMFGVQTKPPGWDDDVWGRIPRRGLDPFLWPDDEGWPDEVGDAVVFRFGYVDCFTPDHLSYFRRWQQAGATLLNPPHFLFDSKATMAALALPAVRNRIASLNSAALPVLDRCLPETVLLQPSVLDRLRAEQDGWLLKYAGFDGGQQAWGGRSLRVGAKHSAGEWAELLSRSLDLPWPIVAQRLTPSMNIDIAYFDAEDREQMLLNGTTRLRAFLLRDGAGEVTACGAHVTVSGGTIQVSEGTDAVQGPVAFDAWQHRQKGLVAS